jgi:hypothetical protein
MPDTKSGRKCVLKCVHGRNKMAEIACERKNELQDACFNNSMEEKSVGGKKLMVLGIALVQNFKANQNRRKNRLVFAKFHMERNSIHKRNINCTKMNIFVQYSVPICLP